MHAEPGAVIFDVGGVLVQLGERERRAEWAKRFGMSLEEFCELIWEAIGSRGVADRQEILTRTAQATGLGEGQAARLLVDFHAHWHPNQVLLGMAPALRARCRLVVLANAGAAARYPFEDLLGLHEIFHAVLISAGIGVEKPDVRAFELAVEAAGSPAERCLFIDDRAENIAAASGLGISGHLYRSNEETEHWLRSRLDGYPAATESR